MHEYHIYGLNAISKCFMMQRGFKTFKYMRRDIFWIRRRKYH